MDKKEFRVLIKYCFLNGKNTVEAKTWLDAEFLDTTPAKSTIKDWYAKFRHGEMRIEDGERSGRPKETVNWLGQLMRSNGNEIANNNKLATSRKNKKRKTKIQMIR
ncbi:hypothetical protein GWI33_003329 [Rhynchophorus ferrugineus]|uniref:Mos1 transposase HTH domain-containing protein n=1 Tax=Rhynchophorus ferrugineus TaxID=354439 RepID=A0A834INR3_RHYFE|nr:hypothetical protein GWI33_003329 [Rhynchophorus ferrugineus]